MRPYQIQIPTSIYFGRNIWEEALKNIQFLLDGTVMIVTTGRSLDRLGYLERIKKGIAGCPLVKGVVVFDKISANPKLAEARDGIGIAKKNRINVIVGFGGGSAIDMAKAIALGAKADGTIEEYFYGKKEPGNRSLPVIAIPTTAGTGSELSKAAIITDGEEKIKRGIRGSVLYPKAAVVDSVFTETVPFDITMQTGFDVLAHAMESYVSKASSPYTRMQSEYAIKTVGKMLPRLVLDLKDTEARADMSYASMMMGINLGNASTGLPHRLQYPLGAVTDTSHGMGLAALYCAWADYEYRYSGEKVERMISILAGEDIRGKDECLGRMREFITLLKLPGCLQELGVDKAQLRDMAAAVSGNLLNDPASQEADIVAKIYEKAWGEYDAGNHYGGRQGKPAGKPDGGET